MSLSPNNYTNNSMPYLIGYSQNSGNCNLLDGDEFTILSNGPGQGFTLAYIPVVSQHTNPARAQQCVDFWSTVLLTYDPTTGILTGIGTEKFNGGIQRPLSVALDRSHENPSVVHIYVAERTVAPPQPDDGSATGTGRH